MRTSSTAETEISPSSTQTLSLVAPAESNNAKTKSITGKIRLRSMVDSFPRKLMDVSRTRLEISPSDRLNQSVISGIRNALNYETWVESAMGGDLPPERNRAGSASTYRLVSLQSSPKRVKTNRKIIRMRCQRQAKPYFILLQRARLQSHLALRSLQREFYRRLTSALLPTPSHPISATYQPRLPNR